jgi:hypothetical protein
MIIFKYELNHNGSDYIANAAKALNLQFGQKQCTKMILFSPDARNIACAQMPA